VPINVYGFLNAEIESVKADGGTTPYASRGRVTDGNSRLGINGEFGVNDDLKAVWQLEGSLNNFDQGGVNDQGQSETLTSRNSYVGLDSKRFGRFVAGNVDSAYRSLVGSGGAMGGNLGLSTLGLDLWNNTSAQLTGNANSTFSRGEARYKSSVHYFSPELYGVQAAASYAFDESRSDGLNRGRWSLAARYHLEGLQIGVAVDQQKNTGVDIVSEQEGYGLQTTGESGNKTTYAKLVASYLFPTHTYLGVGIEQSRYGYTLFTPASGGAIYGTTTLGTMKQTGTMVSLAQEIGDLTLMVSGGQLGKLTNAQFGDGGDYKSSQVSLGAKYRLNKTLTTYTYFTRIRNKSQQSVNLGQNPLYSVGSGTSGAYLSPGDSPQAFGIGLLASF
jgi:predicted porin